MGPIQNPRRNTDPEGSDFSDLRIPAPRYWKRILFLVSTVATFIGTLWMMVPDMKHGKEAEAFDVQIVNERLARIEGKINELNALIEDARAGVEQQGSQVREVKRLVANIDRSKNATNERADERHAEIMSLLTEFKEKGIRRK